MAANIMQQMWDSMVRQVAAHNEQLTNRLGGVSEGRGARGVLLGAAAPPKEALGATSRRASPEGH